MDRPDPLRAQVVALLRGGQAHMGFAAAAEEFPAALINARAPNVGYTFWHLVEHVRITQADILDYVTNPRYREPAWPAEYWPPRDAQATNDDWARSVAAFERDLAALIAVVEDAGTGLFGTVPSGGRAGAAASRSGGDARSAKSASCREGAVVMVYVHYTGGAAPHKGGGAAAPGVRGRASSRLTSPPRRA